MNLFILVPISFPILAGLALPVLRFCKERKKRQVYVASVVIATAALVLLVISLGNLEFKGFSITPSIYFLLKIDNLSRFFLVLASGLWILSTFYLFEYIKQFGKDIRFFSFFLIVYGVIIGLCMSGNFFTLYLFYEMMTLTTYPLVIHSETKQAMKAGTKYLAYSFFGASFALIGFVFINHFGHTINFTPGGVLDMAMVSGNENLLLGIFLLTFIGFGSKAALWPLHGWVPDVYSAGPNPVNALSSGVFTKVGVLAIIRMMFYLFGADFVFDSWAQTVLMIMTLMTVFMGSMLAYKEKELKRRLAYSTISQVSYVLFGLMIVSVIGFRGAMLHILFHAIIKAVLFFAAGAIIYKTQKTYVHELRGIGKSMPITMWCFAIASVALIGVPPTAGIVSKWSLGVGAISSNLPMLGMIGAGVLLISALLTAGYLMSIVAIAFFPGSKFDYESLEKREPGRLMVVPLVILAACSILFGMFPMWLIGYIDGIAVLLF